VAEKPHYAVVKFNYVSKFTAASSGSTCDSTVFFVKFQNHFISTFLAANAKYRTFLLNIACAE